MTSIAGNNPAASMFTLRRGGRNRDGVLAASPQAELAPGAYGLSRTERRGQWRLRRRSLAALMAAFRNRTIVSAQPSSGSIRLMAATIDRYACQWRYHDARWPGRRRRIVAQSIGGGGGIACWRCCNSPASYALAGDNAQLRWLYQPRLSRQWRTRSRNLPKVPTARFIKTSRLVFHRHLLHRAPAMILDNVIRIIGHHCRQGDRRH